MNRPCRQSTVFSKSARAIDSAERNRWLIQKFVTVVQ
jgi:hypothetical protein